MRHKLQVSFWGISINAEGIVAIRRRPGRRSRHSRLQSFLVRLGKDLSERDVERIELPTFRLTKSRAGETATYCR